MKKHESQKNSWLLCLLTLILFMQASVFGQTNEVLLQRAKDAIEKNEYESALRDLNAIIAREPAHEAALTQRARAYVRQEKNELALPDAEAVLKINPKNADALNVRGIVKNRKKDYDGALADFNQAIFSDPKSAKAFRNRASVKEVKKMPLAEVLKDYDAYLKFAPDDISAYEDAGNYCLANNGAYAICASYYENYKKLKPDSYVGYFGYALAFTNQFQTVTDKARLKGEVMQNFRRAMELDPKNKSIPLHLGRLQLVTEDYDGGVVSLSQAITLDPKNAWAYAMRGDCHYFKKDYDHAIADYTKAIEISQQYAGAYKFRAKASIDKGVQLKYDFQSEVERKFWAQVAEDYAKAAAYSNQDYQTFKDLDLAIFRFRVSDETKKRFYDEMILANPNNVCARYFFLQSSGYFKNKAAWDELINKFDGKNGAKCASDAALWIGRNYAEGDRYIPVAADYTKAREYYNLALRFDPQAQYVAAWMKQLPSESYGRRNSSEPDMTEIRRKQERIAYVNRMHLQYYNDIVARSAKFNDYGKQRANELDMTPELKAKLLNLMKQEMRVIIDTASKALAEIGSEITADQKSYYQRIVETAREKLTKISQPDYR